jgi:hypothetical protein
MAMTMVISLSNIWDMGPLQLWLHISTDAPTSIKLSPSGTVVRWIEDQHQNNRSIYINNLLSRAIFHSGHSIALLDYDTVILKLDQTVFFFPVVILTNHKHLGLKFPKWTKHVRSSNPIFGPFFQWTSGTSGTRVGTDSWCKSSQLKRQSVQIWVVAPHLPGFNMGWPGTTGQLHLDPKRIWHWTPRSLRSQENELPWRKSLEGNGIFGASVMDPDGFSYGVDWVASALAAPLKLHNRGICPLSTHHMPRV